MSPERAGPPANRQETEPEVEEKRLEGFFQQFKLAWFLLLDDRVPIPTKFIPFMSFAYLLFPPDLIPDMMLGLGQLDDLAVILLGLRAFIALCPQQLVSEYLTTDNSRLANSAREEEGIIDVEPIELREEEEDL